MGCCDAGELVWGCCDVGELVWGCCDAGELVRDVVMLGSWCVVMLGPRECCNGGKCML